MRAFLAILVGFTLIHDGFHLFRCVRTAVGHRLPVFIVSSATTLLRSALVVWAYLSGHVWLTVVGAGLGGLVIYSAYAFDQSALRHAVAIANRRTEQAEDSN